MNEIKNANQCIYDISKNSVLGDINLAAGEFVTFQISNINPKTFEIILVKKTYQDAFNIHTRSILWDASINEFIEERDNLFYIRPKINHLTENKYTIEECLEEMKISIIKKIQDSAIDEQGMMYTFSRTPDGVKVKSYIQLVYVDNDLKDIQEIYKNSYPSIWRNKIILTHNNQIDAITRKIFLMNRNKIESCITFIISWNARNKIFEDYFFLRHICYEAINQRSISEISNCELILKMFERIEKAVIDNKNIVKFTPVKYYQTERFIGLEEITYVNQMKIDNSDIAIDIIEDAIKTCRYALIEMKHREDYNSYNTIASLIK